MQILFLLCGSSCLQRTQKGIRIMLKAALEYLAGALFGVWILFALWISL